LKYFTIIISVLILIVVLIPGANVPNINFIGFDKIVHISMFAAWAVALRFDVVSLRPWAVVMLGMLFSLFTEITQLFVEGRSFDLYDLVADLVGLMIGVVVAGPINKVLRKVLQSKP
jgi:VanZ family protein